MQTSVTTDPATITPAGSPSEKLYLLLKRMACESPQPVLYSHVAALLDVPRWRLAKPLGAVAKRCAAEKMPDLTAYVVKQDGKPGSGFTGDAEATRMAAFKQLSEPYWHHRRLGVHQDVDDFGYTRLM